MKTDPATPVTPEAEPRPVEAMTDAIESQNLYHGRYGTTPAGRTTALAILSGLRNRGFEVRAASPDRPEPEPLTLACGCRAGTHLGTLAAIKEAHPDILVPDVDMEHWYFRASPDRLAGGLDEAWTKAEAALPEPDGWKLRLIWHPQADEPEKYAYEARYDRSTYDWRDEPPKRVGRGGTPAAALRALADRLSGLTEEGT